MARVRAALGSLLFLFVAPGVVAVLIPYGLTTFDSNGPPALLIVAGTLLVVAGAAVLLHAFARFVLEGIGTPAPVAPTERLVVGGAYRWVRNPMYLAVGTVILGEALLLGQPVLLLWLALFAGAVATFVLAYEEPTLEARYGDDYAAYCKSVRRWIPRRPRADRDPGRCGRRVSP
jgi:protein-S-isoprenylcysteine O-methyltransferase Ste14